MFSKNAYFVPQVSQSVHPRIPVGINGAHEISFHHPEMVSGHYNLSPNVPPFVDASTFFNQDVSGLNAVPNSATANTFQRKQTVKKDRHSKICTAQGPRDRRVRLSIGIAKKFFDLQEMLGFDKPSKTLDWLLTRSKAAIKELVQLKVKATANGKSRISSPSECEVISAEAFENASSDSKRKGKNPCQVAANLTKESRAKARARARERTREKMCIKQLNGARNTTLDQIPYRFNHIGNREGVINYPLTTETSAQDLIQESIVIKRKTMTKHHEIFGFQQNLFVSRDLSANYNIPSANATDNWDICAILDQHKFINSASNI